MSTVRSLYTISYPQLSPEDSGFIESFRREHDLRSQGVIAAHFTLVFGVKDIEYAKFEMHVRSVAAQSQPIVFTCRYAMLSADTSSDTAYVFLVPDEGFSAVSHLHDRLYEGPLERFHSLEIPFVPHITLATTMDRRHAKQLCAGLNDTGLSISGELRSLSIGALEGNRFSCMATLPLDMTRQEREVQEAQPPIILQPKP